MKIPKILLGVSAALFLLFAFSCGKDAQSTRSPSAFPPDISGTASESAFDDFAWETFIALVWPANDQNTGADTSRGIPDTNDYTTLWETYEETYDIYTRGPSDPAPIPDICPEPPGGKLRAHRQIMKVGISTEFIEAAMDSVNRGPLIDLNRNFVRYEVLYNSTLTEYVANNRLFSKQGLIDFPGDSLDYTDGSLVVKAAWKVLAGADSSKDFFTSQSYMIYLQDTLKDSTGNIIAQDTAYCNLAEVGLVGFHIAWKTPNHPNWIWMTFEHEDNAPPMAEHAFSHPYNFFDSSRGVDTSIVNHHPDYAPEKTYYNPAWSQSQTPAQIMRVLSIRSDVEAANRRYHARSPIQGSIWENYRLIGVQWTHSTLGATPFVVQPDTFLANVSLETFEQGSASCMGCHQLNTGLVMSPDSTKTMSANYMWSAFKALKQDPTENQAGAEKTEGQ